MDKDSIKSLFDKSKITKPQILDGACGCLLQETNPEFFDDDIWMTKINKGRPSEVKRVAQLYLDAGADIITSNTFRTNSESLRNYKGELVTPFNSEDEVKAAMDILHDLRKENKRPFLIAGSNASAEDCYVKKLTLSYEKLRDNHTQHIDLLHKHGADFILIETMGFYSEIEICAKYCFEKNIPYMVSLYIDENLKLFSGENVLDVLSKIDEYKPLAISMNCFSVDIFKNLIKEGESVVKSLSSGFGYYLNCGDPKNTETNYLENNFSPFVTPSDYVEVVKQFEGLNPVMVGSCCMSTPEHTKAIVSHFAGK